MGRCRVYWRPDHGTYVAAGLVLASVAVHGLQRPAVVRAARSGDDAGARRAVSALRAGGRRPACIRARGTVRCTAQAEHARQGVHQWPLLRFGAGVFEVEPAARFTPTIGIRWQADSSLESRREILARYHLTPLPSDDGSSQRVKLSQRGLENLRAILNENIVDDTAGIDRSTATLPSSSWPAWDRWSFRIALLRLRVLPSLDRHTRASEIVVALFFALPIVLAAAAHG